MRTFCTTLALILFSNYVIAVEELRDNTRVSPRFLHSDIRVKRQQQQEPDPTDQFFNRVFDIPISTLTAVNELIKSTRPVIRRARERIQQQYQNWQGQNGGSRPRPLHRSEE